MKFLESITFMGNDVLIPIKKIEYITLRQNNSNYEILIKGQGEYGWEEHFKDEKKALKRYNMIKEIVEAK